MSVFVNALPYSNSKPIRIIRIGSGLQLHIAGIISRPHRGKKITHTSHCTTAKHRSSVSKVKSMQFHIIKIRSYFRHTSSNGCTVLAQAVVAKSGNRITPQVAIIGHSNVECLFRFDKFRASILWDSADHSTQTVICSFSCERFVIVLFQPFANFLKINKVSEYEQVDLAAN
jgi:hypothetical protein